MSEDCSVMPLPNQCDGECDRISQLPDDIILHILSFLPLRNAVVTSTLSSRWLDLWKYKPNLKFLSVDTTRKNLDIVTSVIESYKAPILKEFSVTFLPFKLTQSEVTKWLKFAFSRRVERLNLDLLVPNEEDAAFLDKILRESKIPACEFKFLKELRLANYRVGGEAIELLLRNCTLLEKLTIKAKSLVSDVNIFGKLKQLDINVRRNLNSIRISSAPNLTRLSINHPSERVSIKNVPKLVTMDFRWEHSDTMHHFASVAAHLETLTITLNYPKSMSLSVPEMPRLKKLTLHYKEAERGVLLPITYWIQASPRLQEFNLETVELSIKKGIFEVPRAGKFPHLHLKIFEFSGFFFCADDHRGLVRYIVKNCVELQKMKIVTLFPPRDGRGLITTEQQDAWLKLKRRTKKLLARKVPDHIDMLVE